MSEGGGGRARAKKESCDVKKKKVRVFCFALSFSRTGFIYLAFLYQASGFHNFLFSSWILHPTSSSFCLLTYIGGVLCSPLAAVLV